MWKLVIPAAQAVCTTFKDHRAAVDITYDTRIYSIQYKDSSNLGYDGTTIHANYNGWVQNLDKAMRMQLSVL